MIIILLFLPLLFHKTHPMITHVKVGFKPHTYIVSIDTSDVPNTTKNALYNPHWLFVLQEKLNDLRVNHT